MPDYLKAAAAFRAKAAATNFPEEAKILIAKAEELEAKYGNANSRSTDDTVTTGRDGHTMTYDEYISTLRGMFFQQGGNVYYGSRSGKSGYSSYDAEQERRRREAERIAEELRKNQHKWNEEYYDKDGNPKPQKPGRRWRPGRQRTGPDVDDIYEEAYKYADDEDAGYDDWLGGKLEDE